MKIEIRKVLKSYTALIGGSVVLSSMQAAQAAHGQNNVSFREFRQQNAGLDRHVARGLFNAERRHGGSIAVPLPHATAGANSSNQLNSNTNHVRNHGLNGVVKLQSLQVTDTGNLIRLNKGIDLDLTSNSRNITLGRNLFSNDTTSVQIQEGGELRTVTAGSQVTAAEYIAVKQALSEGGQKVSIDRSGSAVGGEVNLDAITGNNDVMRASDLVVAANVTTYGDFGKRSDFKLLGDLSNYGTVFATNSNDRKGGAIRAEDIYNHANASINSTVDLTLDAAGNLSNEGSISSSGALTLIAVGAVRNSGSITSQNDLNLSASTINNRGTVQSSFGNINLDGSPDAGLSINNSGGTFNASSGAINVRSTAYNGAYDTTITGGDLLSRELNLNSGQGLMSVNVNQLNGTIDGTGTAAHVAASTDILTLGKVCLTGDPTFYNSAGDIAITGDVSVQEALTIIASGDITTGTNVKVTAGDSKQGYDITMIAGAAFVATGGKNSATLPAPLADAGSVQLTGKATKAGGSIIFGNGTQIFAQQQGGSGDLDGGDVLLFAFGGKDTGSGLVDTSNSVIFSGATGAGQNGDVALVGGAKTGDAVIAGSIISNGGVGTTGGDVALAASQPIGKNVSYAANGKLDSGPGLVPSTKINKAAKVRITNAVPGTDLDVGRDLAIGGATVDIFGETKATGVTAIAFVNSLTTQSVGNVFSPVVIMKGAGSIGTQANPFSVDSGALQFVVGGDAYVNEASGGILLAGNLIARDHLVLNVPNRKLQMTFPDVIDAANVELNVAQFGGFGISGAKESITLKATDPLGPVFNGNFGGTKEFVLDIASGIGTSSKFFQLDSGLGKVSLTAPDVYAVQLANNKKTEVSVFAVNHGAFHSIGGMNLRDSNVTQGDLEVISGNGTLTVGGTVQARDAIYINNAGDKSSSKLAILANTTIETYATSPSDGSINILLSPNFAKNPYSGPPIANVTLSKTGGTIDILGNGFVAEAPNNQLSTIGASAALTISNEYAAKNMTLGGNVLIEADPPVAAGTPTIIVSGPAVEQGGSTSGVKFNSPNMMAASSGSSEITTFGLSNSNSISSGINFNQTNDAVANLMTATLNAASARNDDSYIMTTQPNRLEHDAVVRNEVDTLNNGSILLVPDKDTKVSTPVGTINVAAGSTVLISVDSNQLSVYDFHDEQARGVSIEVDGRTIALSPGRHVCVTRDRFNAFADVNPIEAIPHRSMSRMDLNNGKTVFHSEFSIANAANVIKPVRAILSAQDKETKKIAGKILKTTAAVLQVSGSSHPFVLHAKPTAVVLSSL